MLYFIFTLIIFFLIINIIKQKKIENELKENQLKLSNNFNFLRTLLDTLPNPIFCKDADGKYTDCNISYENYLGLKKEDIINKTVYDINQGDLADIYHKADLELMNSKGTQSYESQLIAADKKKHDVLLSRSIILSNDEPIGIVGVILDITERIKNEDKLNRLLKFKEAMIEINQSIIGLTDINELFNLILSKSIKIMKGAKYGSVLLLKEDNNLVIVSSIGYDEKKVKDFNIPLDYSFHYLKTNGKITDTIIIDEVYDLYNAKYVNLSRENWEIVSCISTPIIINNKLFGMLNIDSDEKGIFNEDDIDIMNYMKSQIENTIITHNLYNEIMYLSKYDKLTNVYNRRAFEEIFDKTLNKALKYNTTFLLVIFDLNGLKFVNDNFGHLEGDQYINTFVNKLKDSIYESDILARYGGDEFIGIFLEAELIPLLKKFEEINKHFSHNPIIINKEKITCSFSYGVASYPADDTSYSKLIKIADERMYTYKYNFKNTFK